MRFLFFTVLFLWSSVLSSQNSTDWSWWNELHDWQEGDPGWREMMTISPGFFGPNGLPVPEVKNGLLKQNTEFALTASNHFNSADPTQDISANVYIPFANNKIAVEMYGVIFEHFAFSEQIRNERIARIEDGKGNAIGDFYFNTLIQLVRNKKFPNTLFRFGTKTASGNQLEGARFTDTPGYYLDFSFSKDFGTSNKLIFRPLALIGFYSWQTNDWLNLQNDALMYALGTEWVKTNWYFAASLSGYSGYKQERDKPRQMNIDFRKELKNNAIRLQYNHGIGDWEYKTIRVSYIHKMSSIN